MPMCFTVLLKNSCKYSNVTLIRSVLVFKDPLNFVYLQVTSDASSILVLLCEQ